MPATDIPSFKVREVITGATVSTVIRKLPKTLGLALTNPFSYEPP